MKIIRGTFLYLGVISFLLALSTVFINNLSISIIFLVAGGVFILATIIMGLADKRAVFTEEELNTTIEKKGGAIR